MFVRQAGLAIKSSGDGVCNYPSLGMPYSPTARYVACYLSLGRGRDWKPAFPGGVFTDEKSLRWGDSRACSRYGSLTIRMAGRGRESETFDVRWGDRSDISLAILGVRVLHLEWFTDRYESVNILASTFGVKHLALKWSEGVTRRRDYSMCL